MPVGAAIAAMFLIQSGASLAKGLFPLVGAAGATVLRLLFASIMMLAIWRPWRTPVAAARRAPIAAYGVVLGAMNLTFYLALNRIPLGIAVALEFTGPLGLALISSRRSLDVLWVAIASVGVCLLLPIGAAPATLDPLGVALALGAGVFWALYILFGQKAGAGGSGPAVAYGSIIAGLVVAPFGFVDAGPTLFSAAVVPTAVVERDSILAGDDVDDPAPSQNLRHFDERGARNRCAGGIRHSARASDGHAADRDQPRRRCLGRNRGDPRCGRPGAGLNASARRARRQVG
jgi:inner membrane transporter RhtA